MDSFDALQIEDFEDDFSLFAEILEELFPAG